MTTAETPEQFEALLVRVRDHAEAVAARLWARASVGDERNEKKIGDARAVWHASEIALGMLSSGYVPTREAMFQAAEMVDGWRENGLIEEAEG
jgi:hypothetical protein